MGQDSRDTGFDRDLRWKGRAFPLMFLIALAFALSLASGWQMAAAQKELPPPTITKVDPGRGMPGQSLELMVRGDNFTEQTVASFSPAAGITVVGTTLRSPQELTASIEIAPDALVGPRSVTVTNPDAQSATLEEGFFVAESASPTPTIQGEVSATPALLAPTETLLSIPTPAAEASATGPSWEASPTASALPARDLTATATREGGGGMVVSPSATSVATEEPIGEQPQAGFSPWVLAAIPTLGVLAGGLFLYLKRKGPRRKGCSSTAQRAARLLLESIPVARSSLVYVTGPIEPGAIIREDLPENESRQPAQLSMPSTAGTFFGFFIDDEPHMKFEHDVRYGWADLDSGRVETVQASNRMTILPPDREPKPYHASGWQRIKGIGVICGQGDFAGEGQDIEGVARAPEETLIGDEERRKRKGKCTSVALVFDCGDKKDDDSLAKTMAEDADSVAKWLKKKDWVVGRLSQYWGNAGKMGYPAIKPTGKRAKRRYPHLYLSYEFLKVIKSYGQYFKKLGPGEGCCHEFFLYINAHGVKEGAFRIYDPSGNGNNVNCYYAGLLGAIRASFSQNTKVTLFIDACYGGKIIEKLKSFNYDSKLCDQLCGLTIITSTDGKQKAASGKKKWGGYYPKEDSGTQDFLQGGGGIRKNFEKMKKDGGTHNPQSFHCPTGTPWCSLDETTPVSGGGGGGW